MIEVTLPFGVHNGIFLDKISGCATYHGVTAEVGHWLREHGVPIRYRTTFCDGDESRTTFTHGEKPTLGVLFEREADAVLFKLTWL